MAKFKREKEKKKFELWYVETSRIQLLDCSCQTKTPRQSKQGVTVGIMFNCLCTMFRLYLKFGKQKAM